MDDRTELEGLLHLVDEVMRQGIEVHGCALPGQGADSEPLELYDELIELIECKRALLIEREGDPDGPGQRSLEDALSLTGQLERLRAQRQFWAGGAAAEH